MKRSPKQWFYMIYFWILGLVALHFILNFGLSFANLNGCYRSYKTSSGTLTPSVLAYFDPLQSQCQVLIIIVKQLYAKNLFENSQLHFIIKPITSTHSQHTQLPFLDKNINIYPQEHLEFECQINQSHNLGLFVFVVSQDSRVANIGFIPLDFDQNGWEKKEYLRGIYEQNGFIIYSVKDQPYRQKKSYVTSQEKGKGKIVRQTKISSKSQPCINNMELSDIQLRTPSESPQRITPSHSQNINNTIEDSLTSQQMNLICEQTNEILQSHKAKNLEHKTMIEELQLMQEKQKESLKALGIKLS